MKLAGACTRKCTHLHAIMCAYAHTRTHRYVCASACDTEVSQNMWNSYFEREKESKKLVHREAWLDSLSSSSILIIFWLTFDRKDSGPSIWFEGFIHTFVCRRSWSFSSSSFAGWPVQCLMLAPRYLQRMPMDLRIALCQANLRRLISLYQAIARSHGIWPKPRTAVTVRIRQVLG